MPTFRTVTNSRFSTPKKGGSFFKDKENRRWVIHIDWSEIMRITWDVSQTRLNYEWVSWHGNSRMILIRCHMCYTSSIYIYIYCHSMIVTIVFIMIHWATLPKGGLGYGAMIFSNTWKLRHLLSRWYSIIFMHYTSLYILYGYMMLYD